MDVALIVTGGMERRGLAPSLKKVFPEVDFSVQQVDSFTSAKVQWPPLNPSVGIQTAIEKYATALVAAINPGRRRPRPNYVFGIEDLELANREHPEVVIESFRKVVAAELQRRSSKMNRREYDKLVDDVKECCSFHLFAPMPEGYFFACPSAFRAIGCNQQPVLVPDCNVELFEASDEAYVNEPQQPLPSWAIDPSIRPYHPKRYLQFLLRPGSYSETIQGVDALAAIDWQAVLGHTNHCPFLHSLFQDLAYAVQSNANFPGNAHALTAGHGNRDRILRNF